ncbi:MAG: CPBP family intramembrane metalloprotease [Rhodobacteraceae bacterium]|nr:CPBP family intramembrane metalloprotease [Paracoccaceae bacterium]
MPEAGRYARHEWLVAPVRARAEFWRLPVGLVVLAAVSMALGTVFNLVLSLFVSPAWILALADGGTPGAMLALLGSFAFLVAGVAVVVRTLQRRSLGSVIGPLPLAVSQFARTSVCLVLLMVCIAVLPPYDMGEPLQPNLTIGVWLTFLPLGVCVLLIQTGAEEILFRGYLQQSLAARFKSPLIWMWVPSALFAIGHYVPAEAGDNAALVAIWAGLFGILMADLTARAGTLGPAIAVHMFNNFTALLIVASPTSLNGLSLFLLPYEMSDTDALRPWLAVDFAFMIVAWLVARVAIRR